MFHVKHFASLYTLVIALVLRGVMFHVKHHSPLLHIAQKFRAKFFLFPVEISLICAILFSTILEWPGSSRSGRRRVSFLAKIIAIVNQKGGVGKTTTCVNLTAVLRERGKRVLLCDFDPQANSTSGMGVDKTATPNCYDMLMNGAAAADCIRSTKYGDVLPANMNLSGCSVELVSSEQREYIMKTALAAVQDDYDFILIDCPPSLELLTINALVAADSVLIPVQCEYYALEGIADLMRSIKMCNKRLNPELTVQGIVMTMYDGRTKLSDQVVNEVRKFFGKKVYKTMIPRNVRLSEAPSHRKPAIAYDKESKGARAYLHLAGELIKREEKAAKAAEAAAAAAAAEVEYG